MRLTEKEILEFSSEINNIKKAKAELALWNKYWCDYSAAAFAEALNIPRAWGCYYSEFSGNEVTGSELIKFIESEEYTTHTSFYLQEAIRKIKGKARAYSLIKGKDIDIISSLKEDITKFEASYILSLDEMNYLLSWEDNGVIFATTRRIEVLDHFAGNAAYFGYTKVRLV